MTAGPVPDPRQAFACCVFDDEGRGHDGPCAWTCALCGGTGLCPQCAGTGGEDDLDGCEYCDAMGSCPTGCANGVVLV